MSEWTYIYKDKTGYYVEGVRKRKPPEYAARVPIGFMGFAKITDKTVTLYNKDWTVCKVIKRTATK